MSDRAMTMSHAGTLDRRPKDRWRVIVLAGVYLGLASAYVIRVPLFEAPDEQSHIHYVGYVASEWSTPRYGERTDVPGEGMQAPLYYWISAPIHRLFAPQVPDLSLELGRASSWLYGYDEEAITQNRLLRPSRPGSRGRAQVFFVDPSLRSLRALRWISVAGGLAALLLCVAAVRRLGGDARLALLAGALLALNPQFVFVSASVSNETTAAAVGAATFWLVAPLLGGRSARSGDYLLLGAVGGLAQLTKLSLLPVVGIAGLTLLSLDRRGAGRRLRDAAAATAIGVVVAGPYMIFSAQHRGDLLGATALMESGAAIRSPEAFGGVYAYLTGVYPALTFESYWALFGWMNVPAPRGALLVFALISCAGVAGFGLSWWSCRRSPAPGIGLASHRYLAAVSVTLLAAHLWINTTVVQPQGRHLFPAASQIACLLALGLARLGKGSDGRSALGAVSISVAVALAGLTIYCLVFVIGPSYSPLTGV